MKSYKEPGPPRQHELISRVAIVLSAGWTIALPVCFAWLSWPSLCEATFGSSTTPAIALHLAVIPVCWFAVLTAHCWTCSSWFMTKPYEHGTTFTWQLIVCSIRNYTGRLVKLHCTQNSPLLLMGSWAMWILQRHHLTPIPAHEAAILFKQL